MVQLKSCLRSENQVHKEKSVSFSRIIEEERTCFVIRTVIAKKEEAPTKSPPLYPTRSPPLYPASPRVHKLDTHPLHETSHDLQVLDF